MSSLNAKILIPFIIIIIHVEKFLAGVEFVVPMNGFDKELNNHIIQDEVAFDHSGMTYDQLMLWNCLYLWNKNVIF